MISLPVYDKTGKEVGTYEVDPAEIAPKQKPVAKSRVRPKSCIARKVRETPVLDLVRVAPGGAVVTFTRKRIVIIRTG